MFFRKSRGAGDGPVTVSGKGLLTKPLERSPSSLHKPFQPKTFLKQACATCPPPPTTIQTPSSTSSPGRSCSRWSPAIICIFNHLLIQYYTVIVQGIACQQKGYILRGKITDPSGTAKLSFELEVFFNQMMTE